MVDTKDLEKIKEYDKFVLFRHKKTGVKECILKIDLVPQHEHKIGLGNKWDRDGYKIV
jgi:hypothetical protein